MIDYQRIVDEVRSSLFSNNAEGADFLRTAAADYSVAADEINERLRRCGTLLRQGLRSEAIQLAEIEPNLLDLVATLDFPERQHWVDVLTLNGIVAPRPLMLDVAADLNEAYAIEQPLAELLRQHRLLALSRGPLNLRVSTLRSLAQSDENNPVWQEDLSLFEHERQKELQKEVAEAAKAGDLATITLLDDELRSEGWLELPPRELVNYAADTRRRLEGHRSRADLADAVRNLNDSYAACDVDIGRQWREHFKALAAHCGVGPGDELVEQATPALAWLAEQDELAELQAQHNAAVAELESALRNHAPARELIRRHNKARANGFALSDRLVQKVKDQLAEMERAKTLKRRALIGGITISLLLIVGLTWFGVVRYLHGRDVARQADALNNLLDEGDLTGAQSLLDDLGQTKPSVAASDEIQRLGDRLDAAVGKEKKRHDRFESALQRARDAGSDSPDYDALNDAGNLATTEGEKAEIKTYKDGIAAAERDELAKHDAEFTKALVDFETRLKKLETGPNDDIPAALAEVEQFPIDLTAAERRIGSISGGLRSQIDPMLGRLKTVDAGLRRRRNEESQLQFITKAVGDVDAYRDALAKYAWQFPNSPRSADFKTALDDAPIWLGLQKWNGLLVTFRKQNLAVVNPETAATLVAAGNQILKDYGNYPSADSIRRSLPYLEAVSHRVDAQNASITEPLKELFGKPWMSNGIWSIELMRDNRKKAFYLKQAPQLIPDRPVPVSYITGFEMNDKPVPGGVRAGEPLHDCPAPQTILAKTVREQLVQLNDSTNWEATFYRIVQTILADDPPIDPILKFSLLQESLEDGSRGSHAFEKAFAPQLAAMRATNIDPAANWLDPDDPKAARDRASARALFHEAMFRPAPDILAAGNDAKDQLDKLGKPAGKRLRWVGWLRRGGAGAWRCNADQLGNESGDLFLAKASGGGATLVRIGKLDRGIPELIGKDDPSLAEGRPIYMELP